MFLIKKFLFCFSLEQGGRLIGFYCSFVNCAYITVLMMVLNSFDVLNEKMTGFEKFQILMVATCVNFFIYYIFGAMVLTVGVIERNPSILKSFFMFHTAMTISIFFGGLFFSLQYSSPSKESHQKHVMHEYVDMHGATANPLEEHGKGANIELLVLTTVDFFIRSYMTLCVYSLYVIFKSEHAESEFMNGSDKQRLSYGSGTGSMDKMTDNCSIINER